MGAFKRVHAQSLTSLVRSLSETIMHVFNFLSDREAKNAGSHTSVCALVSPAVHDEMQLNGSKTNTKKRDI